MRLPSPAAWAELIAGHEGNVNGAVVSLTNGSITNVTGDRIASIVAGRVTAANLSSANAVASIVGLHAAIVGADVNGDGKFSFTEGNNSQSPQTYELPGDPSGDGDVAIDGVVIVKAGQFKAPKPPVLPGAEHDV